MNTKMLAVLALATIANANDLIVGLKTDGTKFFDENRQANPALWRQMDNVTIKAPENEVIRRVVITDLRPEKDGDVKVVEGGEGQKNVTIELKSPTVLRGYEFHIEVYSTREENVPVTNDQQGTPEVLETSSTAATTDLTTNIPEISTNNNVPAILTNDEVKNSERQGRNTKNDGVTGDATTESTSTTFSVVSTTQQAESTTENHSVQSDTQNKFEFGSANSQIPVNNFNNRAIPVITGQDIAKDNVNANTEDRHVRDTESEKTTPVNLKPKDVGSESTESDEEATTTEKSDVVSDEEKVEDKDQETKSLFNNRKYTSMIPSKIEQAHKPIQATDSEKLRNARATNDQQFDKTTNLPEESTTMDVNAETTTLSDDCVTTESNVQGPVTGNNNEGKPDQVPTYINNRQWDQRFNNPTFSSNGQNAPGLKLYPAVLTNDQSNPQLNSSPDHKF